VYLLADHTRPAVKDLRARTWVGQGSLAFAPAPTLTSAHRSEELGFLLRTHLNRLALGLEAAGRPRERLAQFAEAPDS
jgi:hypothetical protein